MEKIKVLVVDDEPNIRDLLTRQLQHAEFAVATVSNGTAALSAIEKSRPDLVLLDVMLPDMNGFSVARAVRNRGDDTPIIFLTAKDDVADKVTGLGIGDDYITKPWNYQELIARVHKRLRKENVESAAPSILEVGEIKIDDDAKRVYANGTLVKLSHTELSLLKCLMEHPNKVLSKEQIIDRVWEYDFNGEMGIVESYISYLRKKLNPLTTYEVIETQRGWGYMFIVRDDK